MSVIGTVCIDSIDSIDSVGCEWQYFFSLTESIDCDVQYWVGLTLSVTDSIECLPDYWVLTTVFNVMWLTVLSVSNIIYCDWQCWVLMTVKRFNDSIECDVTASIECDWPAPLPFSSKRTAGPGVWEGSPGGIMAGEGGYSLDGYCKEKPLVHSEPRPTTISVLVDISSYSYLKEQNIRYT